MYASNLTTWKPVTIKCKPPAHNLSITAKEKEKKQMYLLKCIFNGFITELFTATFLKNIVAEGSQQLSTRTARDPFITEDLKGFFKCLW
jgi:hypothetical protein